MEGSGRGGERVGEGGREWERVGGEGEGGKGWERVGGVGKGGGGGIRLSTQRATGCLGELHTKSYSLHEDPHENLKEVLNKYVWH